MQYIVRGQKNRWITILSIIIISFLHPLISAGSTREISHLLDSLHATIERHDDFISRKEASIAAVRRMLTQEAVSDEKTYRVNSLLFDEYRKYQVDSALACIDRAAGAAARLGNNDYLITADLTKRLELSMCSRFHEAEKILAGIDPATLPPTLRLLYYEAYACFWEYYDASVNRYSGASHSYRDSTYAYLDPESYSYKVARAASYAGSDSAKAETLFHALLDTYGPGTDQYAMLTNHYATVNRQWGNDDKAMEYYIRSAISDIRNATRETLSLQALAEMMYNRGQTADAFSFTQFTVEDIAASGISFRSAGTYNSYSIITTALREEEKRSKARLTTLLIVSVTGVVILIILVVCIYRQMKRNVRIKKELAKTNGELHAAISELNGTNALLNEKNALLYENNMTKQHYIAEFFDVCFHYISKMEQAQKSLYKLAINKSFAELTKRLQSDESVAGEIDGLYRRFDTIFLKLYPSFVDDFNQLLREEERIRLQPGALLTRELRIYALLRLGITDSSKIAVFLRCSTSTVYNYRTRMRNRAINREKFEEDIMRTKAAHDL